MSGPSAPYHGGAAKRPATAPQAAHLTGRLTLSNGTVLELDGYAAVIAALVGTYRRVINERLLAGNREVTAVCQAHKVWLRLSETTAAVPLGDVRHERKGV
ncbi:MAG TPA: hypothetical protein VNM48_01395 [Chloroflexota bacterium]|nr:hypothetical protein [Chloroflexota bacterium]